MYGYSGFHGQRLIHSGSALAAAVSALMAETGGATVQGSAGRRKVAFESTLNGMAITEADGARRLLSATDADTFVKQASVSIPMGGEA